MQHDPNVSPQIQWLCNEGYRWLDEHETALESGGSGGAFAASAGSSNRPQRGRGYGLAAAADSPAVGKLNAWQHAMLENQRALRRRAAQRFPAPWKWLWTERSLSQASDWWIAHWKASLFPDGCRVTDACCGAGADLVALAAGREATGIDLDPDVLALAQHNLAQHHRTATLLSGRCEEQQLDAGSWLHIDPDRRPDDRRTNRAAKFSPAWQTVTDMVTRVNGAMIKVGPRLETLPYEDPFIDRECLRIWIGGRGECRQQLLLTGALREYAAAMFGGESRFCVLVEPDSPVDDQSKVEVATTLAPTALSIVPAPRAFVFDLHRCLHAAELAGLWGAHFGLHPLTDIGGYYTGDVPLSSPWVQCFQVLEVLPLDHRQLRRRLRRLGFGPVEVKSRLCTIDANRWQKQLATPDGDSVTLLVTRIEGRLRGILARRVFAHS
ncbi:MAG: hypothetical protein KatS3mg111_3898 [Pirellulaceae bacterium]|nr:MAG: hypothetical protein KatS3mg111_3898 [Pirellulaceae bacterium]